MSANLSPCPFCHSTDVKLEAKWDGGMPGSGCVEAYVMCSTCKARGPLFDDWGNPGFRQQAVEAWNKRG